MVYEKVKQSQIIKIALLVSILIVLPRFISLTDVDKFSSDYFFNLTFRDFFLRFVCYFILSWVVIQFNANWRFQLPKVHPVVEILMIFLINILILVITAQIFRFSYPYVTGGQLSAQASRFLEFILTVIVIVLYFVARILRFQIVQRENILENEYLKQQNLQKELTALKNQINPHFLFNSLNSLTSLVRDNKPARNFINKLSFMYRYILQSGERDLVAVQEELKFLESYTYLITTRYRNRFAIDLQIENQYLEKEIPPLAIQLLVENAVKHNEISESNPLEVKVYSEDNKILVKNTIRPRTTFVDSTGNGLINLDKRYKLLKNRSISISKDNNEFCVSLPLN